MASLGDVVIDVHANTEKVGPEMEAGVRKAAGEVEKGDDFEGIVKAADKAGSRAGDGFGKSFIRDASGRLRDDKGRFVTEGEKIGKEAGEKASKAFGDNLEKGTRGRISRLGTTLAPAWIRTIGVWIAAAAPAIVQLIGTLAPVVGILGALVPAAIGGAAAITVLKLAFGGLGDIVKESSTDVAKFNKDMAALAPSTRAFVGTLVALKPVLKDFKTDIQSSFFASFNDVTFANISNALKTLNFNFQAVAYTLGGQLAQAANTLLTGKGLGLINDILGQFDDTLVHLGPILSHFSIALLTIGKVAGPLFESLVGGLDKATAKFSAFITKAAGDGSLKKFFDDALIAGDQLLKLAGSLLSIIGSILEAGAKAGGGNTIILFFQNLAGIFKELNDSGALTAFFKVFNVFFGSIAAIVKPLLPLVSKLISLFGGELVKVLGILTPPLVAITTAIADALIPVLPSLEKAIDSLLPVLSLMGGVLADVFKQVTPDLATVLIDLFASLAQTFIELAPSIKELLPVLGQLTILLVNLLSTQTIAALQTFALVLPIIATAINLYLVPQLKVLNAILVPLNKLFSEFIIPFVKNFGTNAVKEFDALGKVAGKVGDFFVSVGGDIADFFTKTIPKWFGKIGEFFTGLPSRLAGYLKTAIKQAFDTVLVAIGLGLGVIYFTFTKLPGRIIDAIGDLGSKMWHYFTEQLEGAKDAFVTFVEDAYNYALSIPGRIGEGLSNLGTRVKKIFTDAWDSAVDTVKDRVGKIIDFVKGLGPRIAAFGGKLLESGALLVTKFLHGLAHPGKIVDTISDTVFGFLKDKVNYVITKLNQGIDKVGHFIPGGIPHIPKLAKGAFLKHPTLALLAEAGPEVVLPTNDPTRARQLLADSGLDKSLGFRSSTPAVAVSVYIGDQELTQIVDTRVEYANDNTARQVSFGTRAP
jgi:phage-related protein